MTFNARRLREQAEQAAANFARHRAMLYRSDGTQIFGDEEHQQRLEELAATRDQALDAVLQEANQEAEAAAAEITRRGDGDPMALLSENELRRANSRRDFVADVVESLPPTELARRLDSVSDSEDRGTAFAYWVAGEKARRHLEEDQREQMRRSGRSTAGRIPTDTPLDAALGRLEVGLWGTTREEAVESARARRSEAQGVQVLASGLKRGGRNLNAAVSGDRYAAI